MYHAVNDPIYEPTEANAKHAKAKEDWFEELLEGLENANRNSAQIGCYNLFNPTFRDLVEEGLEAMHETIPTLGTLGVGLLFLFDQKGKSFEIEYFEKFDILRPIINGAVDLMQEYDEHPDFRRFLWIEVAELSAREQLELRALKTIPASITLAEFYQYFESANLDISEPTAPQALLFRATLFGLEQRKYQILGTGQEIYNDGVLPQRRFYFKATLGRTFVVVKFNPALIHERFMAFRERCLRIGQVGSVKSDG